MAKALVTGGAGYFGEVIASQLRLNGWDVYSLDLNTSVVVDLNNQFIGDIRDQSICEAAVEGMDVVFHNVAQVPLAKDNELFISVNVDGTARILEASYRAGVKEFVYTSSSAVYGLVKNLPVTRVSEPNPIDEYGRAKLVGEKLCEQYFNSRMNVKIIRPRTILGAGRMGIFSLLFEWINSGLDIFILGSGKGAYQFVSARDLANGMIKSIELSGDRVFNLGALNYTSFYSDLNALCEYAQTGSKVRRFASEPVRSMLKILGMLKLVPFAPYQLKLYGKSMYFDSQTDWAELNYSPKDSNLDCLIQGYDWFRNHGRIRNVTPTSAHKSGLAGVGIKSLKRVLKVLKYITR